MYRLIFSFLCEGAIGAVGLVLFFQIAGFRLSWPAQIGIISGILLVGVLRGIPLLHLESTLQQLLKQSGEDRAKVDALFGTKKRPLVSINALSIPVVACLLGLLVRLIRG